MTDYSYSAHGVHVPTPDGERKWSLVRTVAIWLSMLAVCVGLIQYGRGVVAEYDGMAGKLLAAERRAEVAEKQLAIMLRHGDGGIVLANIDTTDMGPMALVVRPSGTKVRR